MNLTLKNNINEVVLAIILVIITIFSIIVAYNCNTQNQLQLIRNKQDSITKYTKYKHDRVIISSLFSDVNIDHEINIVPIRLATIEVDSIRTTYTLTLPQPDSKTSILSYILPTNTSRFGTYFIEYNTQAEFKAKRNAYCEKHSIDHRNVKSYAEYEACTKILNEYSDTIKPVEKIFKRILPENYVIYEKHLIDNAVNTRVINDSELVLTFNSVDAKTNENKGIQFLYGEVYYSNKQGKWQLKYKNIYDRDLDGVLRTHEYYQNLKIGVGRGIVDDPRASKKGR